jgi:hypothetical protein
LTRSSSYSKRTTPSNYLLRASRQDERRIEGSASRYRELVGFA